MHTCTYALALFPPSLPFYFAQLDFSGCSCVPPSLGSLPRSGVKRAEREEPKQKRRLQDHSLLYYLVARSADCVLVVANVPRAGPRKSRLKTRSRNSPVRAEES